MAALVSPIAISPSAVHQAVAADPGRGHHLLGTDFPPHIRVKAIEIIRSLIERIEVSQGKTRGECEVILTGLLVGILAFAQKANDRKFGSRRR
jgi:hypothetical protein